jgi:hypothetical protein
VALTACNGTLRSLQVVIPLLDELAGDTVVQVREACVRTLVMLGRKGFSADLGAAARQQLQAYVTAIKRQTNAISACCTLQHLEPCLGRHGFAHNTIVVCDSLPDLCENRVHFFENRIAMPWHGVVCCMNAVCTLQACMLTPCCMMDAAAKLS